MIQTSLDSWLSVFVFTLITYFLFQTHVPIFFNPRWMEWGISWILSAVWRGQFPDESIVIDSFDTWILKEMGSSLDWDLRPLSFSFLEGLPHWTVCEWVGNPQWSSVNCFWRKRKAFPFLGDCDFVPDWDYTCSRVLCHNNILYIFVLLSAGGGGYLFSLSGH